MAKKKKCSIPLRQGKNPVEIHPMFIKMCSENSGVKSWSKVQRELFLILISRLDWDDCEYGHIVKVENRLIAMFLGLKVTDGLTIGDVLRKEIEYMKNHSTFPVAIEPWFQLNVLYNQDLIEKIAGDDKYTTITFNQAFLNYFKNPFSSKHSADIRYTGPEKPDWA